MPYVTVYIKELRKENVTLYYHDQGKPVCGACGFSFRRWIS